MLYPTFCYTAEHYSLISQRWYFFCIIHRETTILNVSLIYRTHFLSPKSSVTALSLSIPCSILFFHLSGIPLKNTSRKLKLYTSNIQIIQIFCLCSFYILINMHREHKEKMCMCVSINQTKKINITLLIFT